MAVRITQVERTAIVVHIVPPNDDRNSALAYVASQLNMRTEQLQIVQAGGISNCRVSPRRGEEEEFASAAEALRQRLSS